MSKKSIPKSGKLKPAHNIIGTKIVPPPIPKIPEREPKIIPKKNISINEPKNLTLFLNELNYI